MKINLTTQTEILTISDEDLKDEGYLYEYFNQELRKNPTQTNIKTLAYNDENEALVLLIFDKVDGLIQKKITLK